MRSWLASMLVAVAVSALPAAAHAQGAIVHGSVAAAVSDGSTSPAFGGGVTWRVNKALGFGVELSHFRSLTSEFAHVYCCFPDDETRATTFTTNVRLEVPTTSARIIPFVVGGGGVGAVTESFSVIYARITDPAVLAANPYLQGTLPTILPGPGSVENTTTSMVLTLGGGASILVTGHFAIDIDLRVLHILDSQSRNVGRYGVGASYRF